jgi:hypothetical protein
VTAGWRRRVLLLALAVVAAIGAAAGFVAFRARRPIARFRIAPPAAGSPYDIVPYFLDETTLALVQWQDGGTTESGSLVLRELSVDVRSLETGACLRTARVDRILDDLFPKAGFDLARAGECFVRVGGERDTLELWSPRTGRVERTLALGRRYEVWPTPIALSRGGDLVAVEGSSTIEVRSTARGALVRKLPLPEGTRYVFQLTFSPRDDRLLARTFLNQDQPQHALVYTLTDGRLEADLDLDQLGFWNEPELDERNEVLGIERQDDGCFSLLRFFSLGGKLLREVPIDVRRTGTSRLVWLRDGPDPERFAGIFENPAGKRYEGAGVFDARAGRFLLRVLFDETLVPEADQRGPLPVQSALSPSGERLAIVSRRGEVLVYEVPP